MSLLSGILWPRCAYICFVSISIPIACIFIVSMYCLSCVLKSSNLSFKPASFFIRLTSYVRYPSLPPASNLTNRPLVLTNENDFNPIVVIVFVNVLLKIVFLLFIFPSFCLRVFPSIQVSHVQMNVSSYSCMMINVSRNNSPTAKSNFVTLILKLLMTLLWTENTPHDKIDELRLTRKSEYWLSPFTHFLPTFYRDFPPPKESRIPRFNIFFELNPQTQVFCSESLCNLAGGQKSN